MFVRTGATSSDLFAVLTRISHTVNPPFKILPCNQTAMYPRGINALHLTSIRRYPEAPALPLPNNVSEIFANETGRFTSERARDIAAPILLYGKNNTDLPFTGRATKAILYQVNFPPACEDNHVDSYDCFGAISLNGTMQSNVPKPFCSQGKATHLNMPGGQWATDGKYIAENMQKSHYRRATRVNLLRSDLKKNGLANSIVLTNTFIQTCQFRCVNSMRYSTNTLKPSIKQAKEINNIEPNKAKKVMPHKDIKQMTEEEMIHYYLDIFEPTIETKKERRKKFWAAYKETFKLLLKKYGIFIVPFHMVSSVVIFFALYGIAANSEINVMYFINEDTIMDVTDGLEVNVDPTSPIGKAIIAFKCYRLVRIGVTILATTCYVAFLQRVGKLPLKVNY